MRRLIVFAAISCSLYGQARTTLFPPVRGLKEMVGAANNQEVEAGYRLLTQGGNAVDAGVAATFAATVTEQSRVGLGGEIPIIIKLAGKPAIAVSGIGVAPKKATVEFYKARSAEPFEDPRNLPLVPPQGIKSAITPGLVDGLLLALQQYGTKSFAQVIEPALEDADAFPIGEEFAGMLTSFRRMLDLWPDSHKFFYPEERAALRGEIVHMAPLAREPTRDGWPVEKKARGKRAAKIEGAVRDLLLSRFTR